MAVKEKLFLYVPVWVKYLFVIKNNDGSNSSSMCKIARLGFSDFVIYVKIFEKMGIIIRSDINGRSKRINLTPKGKELITFVESVLKLIGVSYDVEKNKILYNG